MISNNRLVIAIALVSILIIALFIKTSILGKYSTTNSIEIYNNIIEVKTNSSEIVLYQIPGTTPLVERSKGGKIKNSYSGGSVTFKENHGDTIFVGVPIGNYSVDVKTVNGKVSGALQAEDLEIATISGNVECGQLKANEIDIATTSGFINIGELESNEAEIKTVSGKVEIASYAVNDGEFKSVSGNITINTSLDSFKYSSATITGNTTSEITFDEDSKYKLKTNTVSGDVMLKKLI